MNGGVLCNNFYKEDYCSCASTKDILRTKVLRETGMLCTSASDNHDFDRFVNTCARTFEVPIAYLSLIETDRVMLKSRFGVDSVYETLENSFCSQILSTDTKDFVLIPDTRLHDRFQHNPFVVNSPFIRFYASAPIEVAGQKIGGLCILDVKTRPEFSNLEKQNLKDIAFIVSSLIERKRKRLLQMETEIAILSSSMLFGLKKPLAFLNDMSNLFKIELQNFSKGNGLPCLLNNFKDFQNQIKELIYMTEVILQWTSTSLVKEDNDQNTIDNTTHLYRSSDFVPLKSCLWSDELSYHLQQIVMRKKATNSIFFNISNVSMAKVNLPHFDPIVLILHALIDHLGEDWHGLFIQVEMNQSYPQDCKIEFVVACSDKKSQPNLNGQISPFNPQLHIVNNLIFRSILKEIHGSYNQIHSIKDTEETHRIVVPCNVSHKMNSMSSTPTTAMWQPNQQSKNDELFAISLSSQDLTFQDDALVWPTLSPTTARSQCEPEKRFMLVREAHLNYLDCCDAEDDVSSTSFDTGCYLILSHLFQSLWKQTFGRSRILRQRSTKQRRSLQMVASDDDSSVNDPDYHLFALNCKKCCNSRRVIPESTEIREFIKTDC